MYLGYKQRKTGGLSAVISPMMALYLYPYLFLIFSFFYLSYIIYKQTKTGGLSAVISPMMALYPYLYLFYLSNKENWVG